MSEQLQTRSFKVERQNKRMVEEGGLRSIPRYEEDTSAEFYSNRVRLQTREEAEAYGKRGGFLHQGAWRVVESPDPVNYRFRAGELIPLQEPVAGLS